MTARIPNQRASVTAADLRSIRALHDAGLVPERGMADLARVAARYAVAVTPIMARLIDPADPADPIARQFVPDITELDRGADELTDPIGDERHAAVKGVVHRYPDRVLLKPLLACPVYCRFCFRREVVGPGADALSGAELDAAIGYIATHREIWEVVLTGGDPLLLSPRRLAGIVARLSAIEHLAVIRIHTRVPVVAPERISEAMIAALDTEKALFVVLHANHPRELTAEAKAACRRIVRAGVAMLSQSVLLKGVNDDPAVLEALLRGLTALRVKPYYLHHADLAPGTARFRTSIEAGQAIMKSLRGRVSGLCQPHYVLDLPGGFGKVPLTASAAAPEGDGVHWRIEDFRGGAHRYPPAAE